MLFVTYDAHRRYLLLRGKIKVFTLTNNRLGVIQVFRSSASLKRRRSGQSVTASDFGSNGPRFESGRGRCVESLDKALYSHCPKEKPSH